MNITSKIIPSILYISSFYRLQFLELQLELIDDWRVRLLQLLHQDCEDPLNSLIPPILNSLYYVSSVLMEWGNTVVSHSYIDYIFIRYCTVIQINLIFPLALSTTSLF